MNRSFVRQWHRVELCNPSERAIIFLNDMIDMITMIISIER
jgi:hypothetical protein